MLLKQAPETVFVAIKQGLQGLHLALAGLIYLGVMQRCVSGLQDALSNSVPWADFLVVCHGVLVKRQGKDNLFNNAALGYLRGKITAAPVSLMQVFCGLLWIPELLTPPAGWTSTSKSPVTEHLLCITVHPAGRLLISCVSLPNV